MAHSFLGAVVGSTTTDIWTYSLQTVVLPPTTNVATFVRYTPKGGTPENREYHGSKRDLIAPPAAVFGILHTGAHLHLDIPHGHTAEQTIQLHEQLRLSSNYTIARNVSLIQNLDTSELLRPFKTARRLLKAGKPKIQGRQRSVEIGRRFATKPTQLPNSNTTLQQPVTLHGPTHQDPQLDPPLPILQIGLEYMLQDASYSASNNSLSRTTKRQSPKKSCKLISGDHVASPSYIY